MKVLIVSGIWPPDVGGPASHAPDLAAYLIDHHHDVEVVVTASAPPAPERYPVRWISRSLPKGVVHARAGVEIARLARPADVLYTTGMFGRSVAAAVATRTPYVVKLTGDPAFERARWRGHVGGDVESFQHGGGGLEGTALRALRALTLRGAAHVVCPSGFLATLALDWGLDPARVSIVPNAVPVAMPSRPERDGSELVLAFAGRIGPQKSLDLLLEAVGGLRGVTLLVGGDGDLRPALERAAPPNATFLGSLSREAVLEVFASADAMVLPSSWENFPHTVVEALAVGTPVIATRVGGVPEVVVDGENGLLVEPGSAAALAAAISRFRDDSALRERLRVNAAPSVARFAPDAVFGELERILAAAVR